MTDTPPILNNAECAAEWMRYTPPLWRTWYKGGTAHYNPATDLVTHNSIEYPIELFLKMKREEKSNKQILED